MSFITKVVAAEPEATSLAKGFARFAIFLRIVLPFAMRIGRVILLRLLVSRVQQQ